MSSLFAKKFFMTRLHPLFRPSPVLSYCTSHWFKLIYAIWATTRTATRNYCIQKRPFVSKAPELRTAKDIIITSPNGTKSFQKHSFERDSNQQSSGSTKVFIDRWMYLSDSIWKTFVLLELYGNCEAVNPYILIKLKKVTAMNKLSWTGIM